jgi:hypothetical protein
MPGLPNRPFPENPVIRPDPIGGRIVDIYEKGGYSGILKTGVFCLANRRSALEWCMSQKVASQIAIMCIRMHFMRLNLWLF